MLQSVEWGEYKLGDLFEVKSNPQLDKSNFTFSEYGKYPYFTRTIYNNGILGNVDYFDEEHKIQGECIAVGMLSMQFFYMQKDFYAGQFTKRLIPKDFVLNPRRAQFINSLLNKYSELFKSVLVRDFENKFINSNIQLPVKKGSIDFEFMETFIADLEAQRIAELEAYLTAAGLKDYELTAEEEEALKKFNDKEIIFNGICFKNVFNKIVQGRRLKKEDQQPGEIPFVMSGVTNNGVANYISNPIVFFPKNSITVDIFGNTFYRDYNFGAGDDTGVYWNDETIYDKSAMLFFASVMSKAIAGKFSYGKKLRSSQSLELKMMLPIRNGEIDYAFMQTFISAIQKLVIKDVVAYSDRKMATTKQAAGM